MEKLRELIREQQGDEGSVTFALGEQIIAICEGDSFAAGIVAEDIGSKGKGLKDLEKELKNYADKHHGKENTFCITPAVAEGIIRKFYGIERDKQEKKDSSQMIDLLDYI